MLMSSTTRPNNSTVDAPIRLSTIALSFTPYRVAASPLGQRGQFSSTARQRPALAVAHARQPNCVLRQDRARGAQMAARRRRLRQARPERDLADFAPTEAAVDRLCKEAAAQVAID